jgi:hypothetical protein
LFRASYIGPDNCQAMLLGLHRMDERFRTTNFEKNRTSRVENQLLDPHKINPAHEVFTPSDKQ